MTRNKKLMYSRFFIFIIFLSIISLGFIEGDKRGSVNKRTYNLNKISASGKQGDAYRLNNNNINMPLNRVGTFADVDIPEEGTLGRFGNSSFLFSGGFMMSGYTNGTLWAFAQATASLVENMTPGTVASGPNDPDAVVYVLKRDDEPFGQSWIDWKTAVDKFGADFYDGDGDGQYNPVDKNGNGTWDADEDAPDLLGDETAWCVYTDGQLGAQRTRFAGVNPQGVEIRQTAFSFASRGPLGNMIFIRYRIKNSGLVANVLDSVYFAAWADPDLGAQHQDDLVGIDVPRNAGYTYNGDPNDDGGYEKQVPCFMIDFFLGPIAYVAGETYQDNNSNNVYDDGIDSPITTGYSYRGQLLGIKEFPGAKNLPVSSFVHYQNGNPERGDPNTEFEARNYMAGRLKLGELIDPCNDAVGEVKGGVNCATVDPRFWYSGDPVTQRGWINTVATDQRQLTNVGPFTLVKDNEIEIVVAYVVGQGTDPINSITVARKIDDGAQFVFDGNFRAPVPPPVLDVTVESGEDFIDFIFPVNKQVEFVDSTSAWVDKFQGINVYAYKTNSTQSTISNEANELLYKTYRVNNFINKVYKENAETGGKDLLFDLSPNSLDPLVYTDPATSKIRIRVTEDPFTGGRLVKGKPYYFAFTSYALNHLVLEPMVRTISDTALVYGDSADYYLSIQGFAAEVENVPKIVQVTLGENMYDPPVKEYIPAEKIAGPSDGKLANDIVDKDFLKEAEYEVTFFKDLSKTNYSMFWKLRNYNTGEVLIDSADYYLYDQPDEVSVKITDGFITKIEPVTAQVDTGLYYTPTSNIWYDAESDASLTGVFYPGIDIPSGKPIQTFLDKRSSYITADKLRRVELRFGTNGKAYRFLNGYKGVPAANSYRFAAAINAADTVGKGTVGNWDTQNDRANGYVDVPFTAWVVDDRYPNDNRQLAVGFLERRRNNTYPTANPDGNWDPSDSLRGSGEIIFIFDSEYSSSGNQIEITGGEYKDVNGTVLGTVWTDLLRAQTGNNLPKIPDAADVTQEQRNIFNSPWLNSIYIVGLQKSNLSNFYKSGDILTVNVGKYPYTESDIYRFKMSTDLFNEEEEKALFEKVNVFPNPLYGYNVATSYTNSPSDDPFVTFSNLPEEVTVKVYSLSGQLLRTLTSADKSSPTSPFLRWNLQNESGLRVASGMYLAIVSSPKYGDKILKFAIIMPQKQIQKY